MRLSDCSDCALALDLLSGPGVVPELDYFKRRSFFFWRRRLQPLARLARLFVRYALETDACGEEAADWAYQPPLSREPALLFEAL